MKICMVIPNETVKGGIAAVVNGYRKSKLEKDFEIYYVESYCDGNKLTKLLKGILGYVVFLYVMVIKRPDLVHIHSSFGTSFYRKLPFIQISKWFSKPVINHIHGAEFDSFYRTASEKKRILIRKTYEKCDTLIALSDEWKCNLSEIVSEEKIVVIQNYSQLNYEAYEDKKNRETNHRVLFLGELGKRKGCYDIPTVVRRVAEVIPDVQFILAGDGSEADKKAIQDLVCKEQVGNNVIFPGWIRGNEKDIQLQMADVFFLPSYNEGMPMSILDAMGYGLPIVSTNVGGISQIVINGINGFCCCPGDIEEFSKGIIQILCSKEIFNSYSDGSIKIVERDYSLEAHIEKLETVYRKSVQCLRRL